MMKHKQIHTSMKPKLTLEKLRDEAASFAELESSYSEPSLYGVTDGRTIGGKTIGTYLEHKFTAYLLEKY